MIPSHRLILTHILVSYESYILKLLSHGPLAVLRIYTGGDEGKGSRRGRRREMAAQPRHRPVQRFPQARRTAGVPVGDRLILS